MASNVRNVQQGRDIPSLPSGCDASGSCSPDNNTNCCIGKEYTTSEFDLGENVYKVCKDHKEIPQNLGSPALPSSGCQPFNDTFGPGICGTSDIQASVDTHRRMTSSTSCQIEGTSEKDAKKKTPLSFTNQGVVVGENASKWNTRVGHFFQSYVPIDIIDFRRTPQNFLDDVWNALKEEFDFGSVEPETVRESLELGYSQRFRTMKVTLRNEILRKAASVQEAIEACPIGIDPGHWENFVTLEFKPEVNAANLRNKANKQESSIGHTLGRRTFDQNNHIRQQKHPEKEICRTKDRLRAHEKSDGTPLDSAKEKYEMTGRSEILITEQLAAGSSSKSICKEVTLDEFGVAIGKNGNQISSLIGRLVRTHVPLYFRSWDAVTKKFKDDVWNALLEEYDYPKTLANREKVDKIGDIAFKNHKSKWRKITKKCEGLDEALERCPNEIRPEDWRRWCEWEFSEEFKKISEQNKKNRKNLVVTHTSGRDGYARTIHKMREEVGDPTLEVTLPEAYIQLRTQRNGKILPAAEPIVGQINDHLKKLRESEGENRYKSSTDDVLATVIGNKEGRGRLRGRGSLISSTEYKCSSHARAKLRKMDEQQNTNEEKMLSKISDVVDQRLKELIPDIVAAIKHANVQGASVSQSYEHATSTSEVRNKQLEPTTCEYADNTPVELVSWKGDVVAKGKVARLGATECHGNKIDFNVEEKVSLTSIVNPGEPVYRANSFVETLGDVVKGGFLVWPKMFLRYNP